MSLAPAHIASALAQDWLEYDLRLPARRPLVSVREAAVALNRVSADGSPNYDYVLGLVDSGDLTAVIHGGSGRAAKRKREARARLAAPGKKKAASASERTCRNYRVTSLSIRTFVARNITTDGEAQKRLLLGCIADLATNLPLAELEAAHAEIPTVLARAIAAKRERIETRANAA